MQILHNISEYVVQQVRVKMIYIMICPTCGNVHPVKRVLVCEWCERAPVQVGLCGALDDHHSLGSIVSRVHPCDFLKNVNNIYHTQMKSMTNKFVPSPTYIVMYAVQMPGTFRLLENT